MTPGPLRGLAIGGPVDRAASSYCNGVSYCESGLELNASLLYRLPAVYLMWTSLLACC